MSKVKMVAFRSHLSPVGMVARGQEFEILEAHAKPYSDRLKHLAGPLDGKGSDPYADYKLADWEKEAAKREGLEVKRTDGGDGRLRVEDYRAAIEADDAKK